MATNACHEVPDMETEPAIPASSNVDHRSLWLQNWTLVRSLLLSSCVIARR